MSLLCLSRQASDRPLRNAASAALTICTTEVLHLHMMQVLSKLGKRVSDSNEEASIDSYDELEVTEWVTVSIQLDACPDKQHFLAKDKGRHRLPSCNSALLTVSQGSCAGRGGRCSMQGAKEIRRRR